MLFFIFSIGGRRIVDVMHIFDQIRNGNHDIGLGCTFIDCEFLKEVRSGYFSSWIFKCKMCNVLTKIESEKDDLGCIPINKAVVSGTYAIGIGHTQVSEFSASIDIPCMTHTTYMKIAETLSDEVKETAWNEMKLAGIEERRLALEAGDVDEDGIPMCPVIADGQWSKRSYKTKYDAFSGAVSKIMVVNIGTRKRGNWGSILGVIWREYKLCIPVHYAS